MALIVVLLVLAEAFLLFAIGVEWTCAALRKPAEYPDGSRGHLD